MKQMKRMKKEPHDVDRSFLAGGVSAIGVFQPPSLARGMARTAPGSP